MLTDILGQNEESHVLGVGSVEFEMTDELRAVAAQNSAAIEEMMPEITRKAPC